MSTAIAHAQTLATPDLLALNELQVLVEAHPEAKELVGVALCHPVALVHDRATVGFIAALRKACQSPSGGRGPIRTPA